MDVKTYISINIQENNGICKLRWQQSPTVRIIRLDAYSVRPEIIIRIFHKVSGIITIFHVFRVDGVYHAFVQLSAYAHYGRGHSKRISHKLLTLDASISPGY